LLINKQIYIGNLSTSNIHLTYSSFSNNLKKEDLTHITKLYIGSSNTFLEESTINLYELTVDGTIYATNDIFTDSDISYKLNFEVIQSSLDKISQLNGYTFNRNDTSINQRFTGLIAQEVQSILPEAIITKHDGKLRVMYGNLAGLFVEGFKELKKEIDDLKKIVNDNFLSMKSDIFQI
jgi:hypothetical protein